MSLIKCSVRRRSVLVVLALVACGCANPSARVSTTAPALIGVDEIEEVSIGLYRTDRSRHFVRDKELAWHNRPGYEGLRIRADGSAWFVRFHDRQYRAPAGTFDAVEVCRMVAALPEPDSFWNYCLAVCVIERGTGRTLMRRFVRDARLSDWLVDRLSHGAGLQAPESEELRARLRPPPLPSPYLLLLMESASAALEIQGDGRARVRVQGLAVDGGVFRATLPKGSLDLGPIVKTIFFSASSQQGESDICSLLLLVQEEEDPPMRYSSDRAAVLKVFEEALYLAKADAAVLEAVRREMAPASVRPTTAPSH